MHLPVVGHFDYFQFWVITNKMTKFFGISNY